MPTPTPTPRKRPDGGRGYWARLAPAVEHRARRWARAIVGPMARAAAPTRRQLEWGVRLLEHDAVFRDTLRATPGVSTRVHAAVYQRVCARRAMDPAGPQAPAVDALTLWLLQHPGTPAWVLEAILGGPNDGAAWDLEAPATPSVRARLIAGTCVHPHALWLLATRSALRQDGAEWTRVFRHPAWGERERRRWWRQTVERARREEPRDPTRYLRLRAVAQVCVGAELGQRLGGDLGGNAGTHRLSVPVWLRVLSLDPWRALDPCLEAASHRSVAGRPAVHLRVLVRALRRSARADGRTAATVAAPAAFWRPERLLVPLARRWIQQALPWDGVREGRWLLGALLACDGEAAAATVVDLLGGPRRSAPAVWREALETVLQQGGRAQRLRALTLHGRYAATAALAEPGPAHGGRRGGVRG